MQTAVGVVEVDGGSEGVGVCHGEGHLQVLHQPSPVLGEDGVGSESDGVAADSSPAELRGEAGGRPDKYEIYRNKSTCELIGILFTWRQGARPEAGPRRSIFLDTFYTLAK